MATQKELIGFYSKNLEKVISAHGAESDHTTHAFYLLQGAKMNIPQNELFAWVENKVNDLHEETLNRV